MTEIAHDGGKCIRFRSREQIILIAADEMAYSQLLTQTFPGVRFWDDIPRETLQDRTRPPDALPLRSLTECRGFSAEIIFDPDWLPRWEWNEKIGQWNKGPFPYPNAVIQRITRTWRDEEIRDAQESNHKTWGCGRIFFRIFAGNREHESIARKAIRLLNKIASNKDLMMAYTETLEIFYLKCRYAPLIGHHARRWCLEKPDRLLDATPGIDGWGYRPKPEGFVPPPVLAPPPHKNKTILRARAESDAVLRTPRSIVHQEGWVATPADELAYASLLAETFPGIRFVEVPLVTSTRWPMPDVRPQAFLTKCTTDKVHIVFDPTWELRWRPIWIKNNDWQWTYGAIPLPNGTISRSTLDQRSGVGNHPPMDMEKTTVLYASWIYIHAKPGNKKHAAIARKAFDLIGKIANKRDLLRVDNKTLEVIDPNPRRTPWIGDDARRWCLEKPTRRLADWSQWYSAEPNWRYRPKPA